MKLKIFPFLMALPLCFALAACGGEPEPTPSLPPQIFALESLFRNNVKDDPNSDYDGPAYVFCRVSLEAYTDEELLILTENEPHLRDIINATMRSKTLVELKRAGIEARLKTEISEKIIEELSEWGLTQLKAVYFDEYYTTP